MKKLVVFLTAALILVFVSSGVLFGRGADEREEAAYPTRPIQWIVPWGADNESVAFGRILAAEMGKHLGVNIAVQAMEGGSGVVGLSHVLSQPADGYTLLDAWVAPLIFAVLNRPELDYTFRDFEPIGHITMLPFSLVIRSDDDRFGNIDEFIEYARANPGLRYNATGAISVPHAAMATFLEKAGIQAEGVPYPGLAGGFPDLLGGTLDFSIGSSWVIETYGEETKTLLWFLEDRNPWYPDIPAAGELGYDVVGVGWDSLAVRAGTPDHVLEKLREAYRKVATSPEIVGRLREMGFWLNYMDPEETYAFWEREAEALATGVEILQRRARQ